MFIDRLKRLNFVDRDDFTRHNLGRLAWADFCHDPLDWLVHADEAEQRAVWTIIEGDRK